MSIGKAQAQALADGFLDTLGTQPPKEGLPIIEAVLGEAARDFINTAVANLDRTRAVDTGELATALEFVVTVYGRDYLLTVGYPKGGKAAGYYDFVNKGVSGTMRANGSPYRFRTNKPSKAMVTAIMQWMRRQGMGAANIKRPVSGLERKRKGIRSTISQADSLRAMAYGTAVNIKKFGKRPTKYFDNAVAESFGTGLIEALSTALAGDVTLKIRQINNE